MLAGCDRQSGDAAQPSAVLEGVLDVSHKGSKMPDLLFHGPEGAELRLVKQTGKPLLVNLWATWCAPCIAELPKLHGISKAGKIKVIAVSEDMGDKAKVSAFWREKGFADWPLWLDPEGNASNQYQVQTMPTTSMYDATGRELWRWTGGRDWSSAASTKLLAGN